MITRRWPAGGAVARRQGGKSTPLLRLAGACYSYPALAIVKSSGSLSRKGRRHGRPPIAIAFFLTKTKTVPAPPTAPEDV